MSRNKAIKLSKAKYVAFIDSDDIWHPNKLKTQLAYMTENKVGISHTSYNIIDKNNRKVGFREAKKLEYKQLLRSCDIGLSTVMIKKSLLKKNFFAKTKTKEDYILWLKLSKKGVIFFALEETLTSWRKLNDSLSSSIIKNPFVHNLLSAFTNMNNSRYFTELTLKLKKFLITNKLLFKIEISKSK